MRFNLRRDVDIVIIGAGIFGSLLAYELSRHTLKRVALVEAHSPGTGISGKSPGIIAVLDTDVLNQQQALYAYAYYQRLQTMLPGGISFEEITGKVHTGNGIEPFLAAQINPRELCDKVVSAAIQNKLNYRGNGSVSSVKPLADGSYIVTMASETIQTRCVVLAVGAQLPQLLPTQSVPCYVNKAFQANIYSSDAEALELYPQEDLYIIPRYPYCVVGFLHRDLCVTTASALPCDPNAQQAIHQTLCRLQPRYLGLQPSNHNVYVDNFTKNYRAGFHTDDETGIHYICGASGNGITQAPRLIHQITRRLC